MDRLGTGGQSAAGRAARGRPPMNAYLLFLGGTVRTMDEARPLAGAVALVDGRIAAFDAEAIASRGPATEVVELAEGVLLPSFGDGHIHPLWGGIELDWAPVRDCASIAEVQEVVRRYAAERPADEWILGSSYDPALAPGGVFEAAWLDAAVADRPVMLEASDHHCAWL